jgi:hypothetical protein
VVETRRGSRFYMCERSRTDPAYPRYPRLPVTRCAGFVAVTREPPAEGMPDAIRPDPERPEDETMTETNEPFYVSRAAIEKVAGTHRRATLEAGATIDMGVHGPVRTHYRLDAEKDLPLPVDYIVAATGA